MESARKPSPITLEDAILRSIPPHPYADLVSTSEALATVRKLLPTDFHTDDEIKNMIAEAAIARFLVVQFD